MADDFAYDVFLSHSSKDKEIVRAIAERMRMDGLRVWFDDWQIRAGDLIPSKIDEGLEQSRVLVLCMSANAFGSEWTLLESYTFRFSDPLNKERRFIPLRLDDAPIKRSLAQFNYINWNLTDREPEYARLMAECRAETNLSSTDEPSARPQVNHAPRSYPRHSLPRTREETITRARYLNYLETDISNRLAASIHNARLLDINVENRTGSTLPWGYRAYAPSSEEVSFERFSDAFECFNRRLLLLGTPGCGKTTTLLHLVTTLIEEARKDETAPVPLFFNLSSFRPALLTNSSNLLSQRVFGSWLTRADTAFEDWLVNQITALRGAAVSTHVARSWVESGAVALLLDGLDEVAEQYVREVAASLNRSYFQRHPDMPVVVACRSVEYQPLEDSDNTRLWLEGAVVLQPLTDAQVLEYLEKTEARGLKDAVPGDEVLMEMARTPLTLSMMVLAYGGLSPKKMQQDMPLLERRRHLLDTYVSRMMQRHARRNAGIPYDENEKQDQPTVYSRSLIDRALGWMAVRLSERSQTLFPIQDLHDFLIQNPKVVKPQFWSTSTVTAGLIGMLLSVLFAVTISQYSGRSYQLPSLVALAVGACLVGTLVMWQFAFRDEVPHEENSYSGIRRRQPEKPWSGPLGTVLSSIAVAVYSFWACGVILVSFSQLLGGMSPIKLGLSLVAAPALVFTSYSVSTSWWRRILCLVFAVIVGGAGAWASLRFSLAPNLSSAVSYGIVIAAFVSIPLAMKSGDVAFIFGWILPALVGALLVAAFALAVLIAGTLNAVDEILIVSPFLGGIMLTTDKEARAAGFTVAVGTVIGIPLIGFDNFICLVCVTALVFVFARYKFYTLGTSILSLNAIGRWLEARCANALNHGLLCGYGRVPMRFRRFLVYCKEVMLLKTAPNGYEFMHRLLRDHFAIRELIPRLSVSSGPAKLRVIQQLSLQGESSLDALHDLASHNDPQIRAAAALGLGRVPSAQVPSLLKDILHRDSDSLVRAAAVEASRPLAEETARPLLEEASVDADGAVRAATIRAVGRRHPAAFLEILRAGIFDNDEQVVREVLLLISDSSSLETQVTKLIHIAEPISEFSTVGPASLERLHPFLWDPDPRVRGTCAEILGLIGRPESVAPLQRAVTDSAASVRSKVVFAMGQCGDASLRGHLITALRDPSYDVRQAAANGLRVLRSRVFKASTPEDVISALCEALREDSLPVGKLIAGTAFVVIGLVVILGLGWISTRTVVVAVITMGMVWVGFRYLSPLRSLLLRQSAARALQNLEAQPKLVEVLIRASQNGNSAAKETLCSLRGLDDSLFVSYLPSVIDGLINASPSRETDLMDVSGERTWDPLKQLKREEVVAELLGWLRMSGKLKMKAVRALGFLQIREAVPDLCQMLARGQRRGSKVIYWLIGTGSSGLPFAAAQALGQIGDESSVPFLESVARDQYRTVALRTACVNALGQFRVAIAVEALARILENVQSSDELAKECVRALGNTKCIAAVEVLDNVMRSSQKSDLRKGVVAALGEIGGERALALVCTTFKDPSVELVVRNACVTALARIGGPSAERILIDTLRDGNSLKLIRHLCVGALGQSGSSSAIETLVGLIDEGSTNEDLWQSCIKALAEGGKGEAIQILCETIRTRPDNLKLRWACERAVSDIQNRDAAQKLVDTISLVRRSQS